MYFQLFLYSTVCEPGKKRCLNGECVERTVRCDVIAVGGNSTQDHCAEREPGGLLILSQFNGVCGIFMVIFFKIESVNEQPVW